MILYCEILALLSAHTVLADSYYSSIGLGMPRYFVSQKAVGMGGGGLAVMDRLAANSLNPSANDIQGMAMLGVNLEYERIHNENSQGNINTGNGMASGMQFLLPMSKRLTLITMLRPLTTSRYTMKIDSSSDGNPYSRILKGTGGLSAASLGLGYRWSAGVSFAAEMDFLFGSYNEEWRTDFVTTDFRDATDKLNSFLWGIGFDAGLRLQPWKPLSFGLIYRTGSTLHLENRMTLGSGKKIEPDSLTREISYPGAVGAGMALELKKWLLAVDYYTEFWQRYKLDGVRRSDMGVYQRLGGGIEFQDSKDPFEKYHRRIAYRIGAYYTRLPFLNEAGDAVHEFFATAGIGLPFSPAVGRVDLAIEVGQRGDLTHFPYQERIIRFTGSIIGGERWFQRRYQ